LVFDYTARGAVPRAKVPVFVHSAASDTVFSVTSDSAGRYAVSGVPGTAIWVTPDIRSGYYAPCPSGWSGIRSDVEFDLHVVAATLLSTTGRPANMPVNSSIWVSGVVFESTADGKRPVAGATVHLGRASPHSHSGTTTLTDSAGRYLMCPSIPSHGSDISVEVEVERDGFLPASKTAVLGWDWSGLDIQLVRK
jgi:hypothetical protein